MRTFVWLSLAAMAFASPAMMEKRQWGFLDDDEDDSPAVAPDFGGSPKGGFPKGGFPKGGLPKGVPPTVAPYTPKGAPPAAPKGAPPAAPKGDAPKGFGGFGGFPKGDRPQFPKGEAGQFGGFPKGGFGGAFPKGQAPGAPAAPAAPGAPAPAPKGAAPSAPKGPPKGFGGFPKGARDEEDDELVAVSPRSTRKNPSYVMDLLTGAGAVAGLALALYLWRLHTALSTIPEEILKLSPHRWTDEELLEAYKCIDKNPPDLAKHLPPKQERRYIVVGGSGSVGSHVIKQLLLRGQPADTIRNVDFAPPRSNSVATGVPYVQVDISKQDATTKAFSAPWPKGVPDLPTTVIHVAAVIRPWERWPVHLPRSAGVNTHGSTHVINAAKAVGADIVVATSSASLAIRGVEWWMPLWAKYPKYIGQVYDESDAYKPLRSHWEFFSNYAVTKAAGERIIMNAATDDFRTGLIRPGNAIYAGKNDMSLGEYLRRCEIPTWVPNNIATWVSADNVALAHLQFEAALLSPKFRKVNGKTFNVHDNGKPIAFRDLYRLLSLHSVTGFKANFIPALPMVILGHLVEMYHLLWTYFGPLNALVPEPSGDIMMIQPPVLTACSNTIAIDDAARKPVEEGGIAYKPFTNTMDGMILAVREWNRNHAGVSKSGNVGGAAENVEDGAPLRLGAVPAATTI
ncbi:NAD(P)-binding protein [Trichodelitschia bisporula]|uniref:NAD(P)-binding protein n=1 Tax=Trichodelitschia bisporula TaxID=703511 RepID=A0A6G1I818_9PEZI|nr:NAD(P)-binding protein [Trichodelitschia bisporula]